MNPQPLNLNMSPAGLRARGWVEVPGEGLFKVKLPIVENPFQPDDGKAASKPKRIRQRTKPLMNRLEQEFYDTQIHPALRYQVHAQAVTLLIGNGVRYTCDFFNLTTQVADEVKGEWMVDDAVVKLKMAATVFREITFRLNWKHEDEWQQQIILP